VWQPCVHAFRQVMASVFIAVFCACGWSGITLAGDAGGAGLVIRDGALFRGGEPFLKRAGWFGVNTWLTTDHQRTRAHFLAIPFEDVGTAKDLYTSLGLTVAFFDVSYMSSPEGYDFSLLDDCLARAEKAGLGVSINLSLDAPTWMARQADWHWITEDGEKIPMRHGRIHYDPVEYKRVMKAFLAPIVRHIRDEGVVLDYQISGETHAYSKYHTYQPKDISYDPASIKRFRQYLSERFSIKQLSQRYGKCDDFYGSFDDVYPPKSPKVWAARAGDRKGADFQGRDLPNFPVARWDWYKFKKARAADCFSALVEALRELDPDRPVFYEYNHCPEQDTRFFPWQEVAARNPGFNLCNGDFNARLHKSLYGLALVKETSAGPWPNNELDAGSLDCGSFTVDAARIRRHVWFNIALGAAGYNLWAFPNIIGAESEFTVEPYAPASPDEIPARYAELRRTNRLVDSLGALLAGSRAVTRDVALLFLDESTYNWTYALNYLHDSEAILQALCARGLAERVGVLTEYHLENQDLGRFKAIFLPQTPRLLESHAEALARYVREGGTLVMMGETARWGEDFSEYRPFPGGILREVAGVEGKLWPDVRNIAPEVHVELPFGPHPFVHCDVVAHLSIPRESQARRVGLPNDPEDNEPVSLRHGRRSTRGMKAFTAATVNRYGEGRCWYLAGRLIMYDDADPTGAFVEEILRSAGVTPAVRVTEDGEVATGVVVSRRRAVEGTLVFLIENEDRGHKLSARLDPRLLGVDESAGCNVFECFSDEYHAVSAESGWTFDTEIEPVGVRVYLVTAETSLDDILPADKRVKVRGKTPPERDVVLEQRREIRRRLTVGADEAAPEAPMPISDLFHAIDLSGYCNTPLEEVFGKDSPLKPGLVELGEVPAIVAEKDGKGCVRLKAQSVLRNAPELPLAVRGLRAGLPNVKKLHFFGGMHNTGASALIARYLVHYEGGSTDSIAVVGFDNAPSFRHEPRRAVRSDTIWQGADDHDRPMWLYRYSWTNPSPEKTIETIDIIGAEPAHCWFVVWAITAEQAPD